NGATSSPITQTVTQAGTTTSLASSANPSALGNPITLTALVASGAGVPNGSVSFLDGTTNLGTSSLDSSGKAAVQVNLTAGSHSITSTYNASTNFSGSSSPVLTQEVVSGLLFVPVTPCRVVDTRNPNGPFGGPFLSGGTARAFAIPDGSCSIPSTAQAYSLNATVVPKTKLGFLTLFACGQPQPATSTLNSDGRVKAGAAIVPAGTNSSVCAFASDDTDLILDINGYFVLPTSTSLAFYPLAPCRVADTRTAAGPLGGPSLIGNAARTFPILSSSCKVPSTAKAYSLNFTSVPKGSLGFLTTWPAGETQPLVSTLNAPTGAVTANAALLPAGTNGDISVLASNDSDLVIDINGYFAPLTTGGLSLHALPPCRALDTRVPAGSPPINGERDIDIVHSGCGVPASVQAVLLNATVVPQGPLGFLTLWAQGAAQPMVSTLNAGDGAITSNMAIVPTNNGSISAFVSNPSHLILDVLGYFVP
ncbi:MAG TPA: Ig-like domain-containing protein, partial [Candidatus Angelobacter sp.]|nr:Ig-like domain-containing protein [Candidatus Angelobacter sp.]